MVCYRANFTCYDDDDDDNNYDYDDNNNNNWVSGGVVS
jgi:hypothetical protein